MKHEPGDGCEQAHALLDAKLGLRDERITGLEDLSHERWVTHKESHQELADNLRQYKSDSNEWRSTYGDLRADFVPRTEYDAKHEALDQQVDGVLSQVAQTKSDLIAQVDLHHRPNWQLLVSTVALILALYGFAIQPLKDQVARDLALLNDIALHGSPITQERLDRIETRLFGGPTASFIP